MAKTPKPAGEEIPPVDAEAAIEDAEAATAAAASALEDAANDEHPLVAELADLKAQVAECLKNLNLLASKPQAAPTDLKPVTDQLASLTTSLESLTARVDKLSTPQPSPAPPIAEPEPIPEPPVVEKPRKLRML